MKYYYDRYWGTFFRRSVEAGTGPATLDSAVKPTDLELIGFGYSGHTRTKPSCQRPTSSRNVHILWPIH